MIPTNQHPTPLDFAHLLLKQAEKLKLELTGTLEAARDQLKLSRDKRAGDAQAAVVHAVTLGQRISTLRQSLERKAAR